MQPMERHLTVSGFVVHEGKVALHWHRKNQLWLPAGGHIEEGEDPVEAVLREIKEEFDLDAEVVPTSPRVPFSEGPREIEPPYTILNFAVADNHEHVDLIYFCRVVSGYPGCCHDIENPIEWVDEAVLREDDGLPLVLGSPPIPWPPDVRALGLEAIRVVTEYETAGAKA